MCLLVGCKQTGKESGHRLVGFIHIGSVCTEHVERTRTSCRSTIPEKVECDSTSQQLHSCVLREPFFCAPYRVLGCQLSPRAASSIAQNNTMLISSRNTIYPVWTWPRAQRRIGMLHAFCRLVCTRTDGLSGSRPPAISILGKVCTEYSRQSLSSVSFSLIHLQVHLYFAIHKTSI